MRSFNRTTPGYAFLFACRCVGGQASLTCLASCVVGAFASRLGDETAAPVKGAILAETVRNARRSPIARRINKSLPFERFGDTADNPTATWDTAGTDEAGQRVSDWGGHLRVARQALPPLPSLTEPSPHGVSRLHQVLIALGGGTGLFFDDVPYGSKNKLRLDFERRFVYQSLAVVLVFLILYSLAIMSGLFFLYTRVKNDSPVTFYADPRFHVFSMEGHDVADFFATFNQPPQNAYLHVTGLMPLEAEQETDEWYGGRHGRSGSSVEPPAARWRDVGLGGGEVVQWQGEWYVTSFTFSLDLSPWIVRGGGNRVDSDGSHLDGISSADLATLRRFLDASDGNDLATVELRKDIEWPGWEEVATNIKQQIRQAGFGGVVTVQCVDHETVVIHKNKLWANFLHNQATRMLVALSVICAVPYALYMWARSVPRSVRTRHQVDIQPCAYWRLIGEHIGEFGFSPVPIGMAMSSIDGHDTIVPGGQDHTPPHGGGDRVL